MEDKKPKFELIKKYALQAWRAFLSFLAWTNPFCGPQNGRSKIAQRARNLWKGFAWCLFLVWFSLFAIEQNLFFLFGSSPSLKELQKPKQNLPSEIYTADGVLVGKYFTENRSPVPYEKISPWLLKALLATEDIRFYTHSGIDPEATVSILFYLAKGDNRGGSTITQQLAKNLYKIRGRKASRGLLNQIPIISLAIAKLKEMMTALKLEQSYTKEEIITMYLNTVDFGSNSYGVKTAAKTFFNTSPDSLTVDQAAMLVGMLKATTSYNPKLYPKKALARRNTVLQQMVKYNMLSQTQYNEIKEKPIVLDFQEATNNDGVQDYYNLELTSFLKDWMKTQDSLYDEQYDIYGDGLKIYLTIDSRMQAYAQSSVDEHIRNLQRRFDNHTRGRKPWIDEKGNEIPNFLNKVMRREPIYKYLKKKFNGDTAKIEEELNRPKRMLVYSPKKPEGDSVTMSSYDSLAYYKKVLHSSIMAMDPITGHIKAWVGGIDYKWFKYDHIKQSKRQPGSTFKAFVYAAAMDKGFSPCYRVQDAYKKYEYDEDSAGIVVKRKWEPRNAAGYYSGINMTLRHGMGRSVNSIAAAMCWALGPNTVKEYAGKLGIDTSTMYVKTQWNTVPSIALGGFDVSLYDMVGAYSTFVNKGIHQEPLLVSRIEDKNGKIVKQFYPIQQRAMSEEAAFLMVHMLKGTLEEPGGTAQGLWGYNITRGNELAGKTGTSQNQSDGWFMGVTKDLVAGVWTGADERAVHFRTLREGEGSKTALPVFGKFLEKVYADGSLPYKPGRFPKPDITIKTKYLGCATVYPKKEEAAPDSTKIKVDSAGVDAPSPIDDEVPSEQ